MLSATKMPDLCCILVPVTVPPSPSFSVPVRTLQQRAVVLTACTDAVLDCIRDTKFVDEHGVHCLGSWVISQEEDESDAWASKATTVTRVSSVHTSTALECKRTQRGKCWQSSSLIYHSPKMHDGDGTVK